MKQISEKQSRRIKKLAKIKPPKDGRCTRCHEYSDFRGLSKHHIIPRSQGGKDNAGNLEWLCGKCHSQKHHTEEQPKSVPVDKPTGIHAMSGFHGPTGKAFTREMQAGIAKKNKRGGN